MKTQEQVFAGQEADQWFLRNKNVINAKSKENDICYNIIRQSLSKQQIRSVLELGCSNGYRLNFLKEVFSNDTKFVGCDVSKLAVEDGIKRYGLELCCSSLADFSYSEQFDLVIVNFVLHWIDRELLYNCIAKIDSFLKCQNSFLLLGDFYPYVPHKRRYHHCEQEKIYTYKLDYKNFFLASNCYQVLQEYIYNTDKTEKLDGNNRAGVVLLEKNDNFFIEL